MKRKQMPREETRKSDNGEKVIHLNSSVEQSILLKILMFHLRANPIFGIDKSSVHHASGFLSVRVLRNPPKYLLILLDNKPYIPKICHLNR
jgi:hypothetical protein